MSDERWILVRGRTDPMVYPFDSAEAAQEFADEHGMIDWRAMRSDNPAKEHAPICACDREPWPCSHARLDRQAARIQGRALRTCARCGDEIGGSLIRVRGGGELGEDVSYHGRQGACRNMARRELGRLGLTDDLRRLVAEDRYAEEQRVRRRTLRDGATS